MIAKDQLEEISSLSIRLEERINAPLELTFEAILEELGPEGVVPGGKPFPMVLEPWPGGRWYRDLGENKGHLWGHVQVIKPPMLLEICGPLFMSYPAISHVRYQLADEGEGTRLVFSHRSIGLITPEHRAGVSEGWGTAIERVRELAERRVKRVVKPS
jgi:uncharacterized protein YndB with AHSA1/START domain